MKSPRLHERSLYPNAPALNGGFAAASRDLDRAISVPAKKEQQRSSRTREELLGAAETVFVRDGYEKAALADIAKTAGKTRGAIYSHFRDKEDIFLSLVKNHAARRGTVFAELLVELNKSTGISSSLQEQVCHLAHDPGSLILFIEFQLYAIRNPHVRKRFRSVPEPAECMPLVSAWSGTSAGTTFIEQAAAVFAAVAVLEALQMGMRSASLRWDQQSIESIATGLLKSIFQTLFDGAAPRA